MEKEEKIKLLIIKIAKCNDSYYYGCDPLLSDFEYDELVKEFKELIDDKEIPIFKLSIINNFLG